MSGNSCCVCDARQGEVLPRNRYYPPKARQLQTCQLCQQTYCDWCFGPHYCGEGEDTAGAIGNVPGAYASPALLKIIRGDDN